MTTKVLLAATMIAGAAAIAVPPALAAGTPYQLEFTAQVTRIRHVGLGPPVSETQPLTGSFRLVRTQGPLDWPTYLVEQVAFTAHWTGAGVPEPVLMTGAGSYRRGGRGEPQESMTLALDVNGAAFELTSGLLPAGTGWPALHLRLKGSHWFGPGGTGKEELELALNAVPADQMIRYRLLPGSTLTDACLVCGRPDIIEPIGGRFDLALVDENPLFSHYAVLDAEFELPFTDAVFQSLRGGGRYSIGGEVAVLHPLRLDFVLTAPGTTRTAVLTNAPTAPIARWPMIVEDLEEEGGTELSSLHLHLRSAPVRALWFTTSNGMTPGTLPGRHLEGGSVLDDAGRVVKSWHDMLKALDVQPDSSARLDAFTIGPGGEIWFSLSENAESGRIGFIQEGDVVSDRGRRVFTNQELTRNLGFMPPVPDLGLDGLQVGADGEVLFSTRSSQFSERLGTRVEHADIVSAKGTIVRRGKDLLAPFAPKAAVEEVGVDAFYVWPGGEVWFSTADGFYSGNPDLNGVLDGDLLSSEGQVIYRNLDLVHEFQPLEDLANFGLTGLFVVSDVTATPVEFGLKFTPSGEPGAWLVSWSGTGRVFQVEATADLRLPFREKQPIGLEQTCIWTPTRQEFLRVRQW